MTFKPMEEWVAVNPAKAQSITTYNTKIETAAKTAGKKVTVKEQVQYKSDSALGLLIGRLIPKGNGLFGFVIAALLGAIISSLAAVLNAASTIFSMDIYHSYINKNATQKQLVGVGRICVGVFVVLGCLVAPLLNDPKFGGIFTYIQEFQGYVSPGILAVFVFGLLNRRAAGVTGVVGLWANPVLYWLLKTYCPQVDFLNRMAICLGVILTIMFVIGLFFKLDKPVEFKSNTTMNLESSKGAKIVGICVVIATAVLYIVFR
jgi:SSS family solute:Na+ symporter